MDEKKLRVYTTAVSIAGLSVFLLSLWEVYPYYLPGSSRGDIWSYSLMMVLLMVVCRMLPIYFAEDKTLEISFVPVLACAITGGAPLAVVLFGVSTLFTVMQNSRSDRVVIQDPKHAKMYSLRVVVIGKTKSVMGLQPSMICIPASIGFIHYCFHK